MPYTPFLLSRAWVFSKALLEGRTEVPIIGGVSGAHGMRQARIVPAAQPLGPQLSLVDWEMSTASPACPQHQARS